MYFRTLILSAFAIALVTGIFYSAYQAYFITPIILNSEVYEVVEATNVHHIEEVEAWAPKDGVERHSWNFMSNFLICFAYALILLCAMSVRSSVNALQGLFWGIAAYLIIFVAPALGLPPEIPGMEAAQLEGRQAWWIITVFITTISLWLLAFYGIAQKIVAVVLIITPHLLGAPQPETHGFVSTDPIAVANLTALWHDFILQTSIANALLWVIIGVLAGFLVKKYIQPIDLLGDNHV